MSEQISISYEAKTLAKAIYFGYSSASIVSIGIMIQQLLNTETEKYSKQVHECGAMLQERNAETEKLRKANEYLKAKLRFVDAALGKDEIISFNDPEKLRKENEALKAKVAFLLEFARHSPTCPMPARQCDCGLDEIKEK